VKTDAYGIKTRPGDDGITTSTTRQRN
jgi:hypothetical protein